MGGSIAFIGLGRMGRPMATHRVRRDFPARLDALCKSLGAPPVRFTRKFGPAAIEEDEKMVTHRGGCHCGRVRYEFEAEADLVVSECNCSVCSKSGHLGVIVPRERFRLLRGEDFLSEYTFNTGTARHRFCRHCGIKSFYVPRSHPDGVSVSLRCIDKGTVRNVEHRTFDGQNWERHYPKGRAERFPN